MPVMTGRPEAPLPQSGPAVRLARRLRELRAESGMSYRDMAGITNYTITALSQAASGKKIPSLASVHAYVSAITNDSQTHAEIDQMWKEARDEGNKAKRRRREGGEVSSSSTPYFSADPQTVQDFQQFSTALNQILSESGLTIGQIIKASATPTREDPDTKVVQLRKTTVYDVLNGKARPSAPFARVFMLACGMAELQAEGWLRRLGEIQAAFVALREIEKQDIEQHTDLNRIRAAWEPGVAAALATALPVVMSGVSSDFETRRIGDQPDDGPAESPRPKSLEELGFYEESLRKSPIQPKPSVTPEGTGEQPAREAAEPIGEQPAQEDAEPAGEESAHEDDDVDPAWGDAALSNSVLVWSWLAPKAHIVWTMVGMAVGVMVGVSTVVVMMMLI